jgi:primosomal protein N'
MTTILEWSETKKKENAALHFDVLGPSEAFLEKVKGIYRYDSLLKTNQISALHECIASAKIFASQRKWSVLVDIDPYGLG